MCGCGYFVCLVGAWILWLVMIYCNSVVVMLLLSYCLFIVGCLFVLGFSVAWFLLRGVLQLA